MSKEKSKSSSAMIKVYLACPYSSPDKAVRYERYKRVTRKAADLMLCGYVVFSPISHSHEIGGILGKQCQTDCDFWMKQDLGYIKDWADELWVLCLDGWRDSPGVATEIDYALKHNVKVRLV